MPTVDDGVVVPGEGTILSVMVATTMTPVAEVTEIDGPEILVEAVDSTAMGTGLIITRPSLFPEPDKLTAKIWFNPSDVATHKLFVTDITTPGTIESWEIQFNDSNTTHAKAAFHGFLTSFKMNGAKVKSNIGADIEIKLTDIPVFTAGS